MYRINAPHVTFAKEQRKLGTLPEKEAEAEPWEKLCVDMVGPYTIKRRGAEALTPWCVTMIVHATGWFEMKEVKNKEAFTVEAQNSWVIWPPWYPMTME
jgi:hypothetical protein